jgi:hypothetical protein
LLHAGHSALSSQPERIEEPRPQAEKEHAQKEEFPTLLPTSARSRLDGCCTSWSRRSAKLMHQPAELDSCTMDMFPGLPLPGPKPVTQSTSRGTLRRPLRRA